MSTKYKKLLIKRQHAIRKSPTCRQDTRFLLKNAVFCGKLYPYSIRKERQNTADSYGKDSGQVNHMGITWTDEQKQVIELRNRNILVSAAAGSGKTAVLVERIVQKVLDKEQPTDIDRMLIVTFTKAAAAEMRERVSMAVEKRMEKEPDNSSLQRQYTLVHHAQITTIDSFCLYIVRNYFQTIDLEPSFRIADPGELQLLKADAAKEVMEQHYQDKTEGFLRLVDRYATAKSDAVLVDFLMKLYDFSQSYPWPKEWLAALADNYRLENTSQMNEQKWMQELLQYLGRMMADLKKQMEYALALCKDDDGPGMYLVAVQDDIALLEGFAQCQSFAEYGRMLHAASYTKLGVNRKYEGSAEKQEQVKNLRKTMKDTLGKLRDSYFYQSEEEMLSDIQKILPDVEALAELAQAFTEVYQTKKAEKNLLDFSDIEHFALKILIDEQTKEVTAAARELREYYEEIMIDEYQDSNYVQETILRAVSREDAGQNNIFMVGDVKQSIYRFRLARPELFIEKYKTYTTGDSERQKIDLHQNFRSRSEALKGINRIFYKIMHEDLGNVEYDEQAALYAGASYPAAAGQGDMLQSGQQEQKQESMFQTELLLAQADGDELAEAGINDWQELEARMAAVRIKELLETQLVTDKESGKLRPARYRDIVILLRSVSGWADTFSKALAEAGIPAHTASRTGYFSTAEIQTILSMLSILDNPLQDIPLAAVLMSPVGGFHGDEMAQIRTDSKEHFFYPALQEYAQFGREEPLRAKAAQFLELYEKLRSFTAYTPIHKLIQIILKETGYASYIQAMPAGAQRRANVDMLLEKAAAYEKTSYKGLFHFVQYIEKLKKYEVDFGEADITSENEDVVRIMSIHKSKGLEFPIVFVCGMGKQFNQQDIRSRMILHPEYGIGLDCVDADRRIRKSGLIKKVLENQILIENQGEELRVLYVALTRAKEKLIMTGAVKEETDSILKAGESKSDAYKSYESKFDAYKSAESNYEGGAMDYFSRIHAKSYLDWVMPCVMQDQILYKLRVYRLEQLQIEEAVEAAVTKLDQMQVSRLYQTADSRLYEGLDEKLSWKYGFAGDTDLKTKISVSELKHRNMVFEEDEPPVEELFPTEKKTRVPAFMRAGERLENQGALRGSAVHKVMEEVDFIQSSESGDRMADIELQMEKMLAGQRITPEMKALANPRLLAGFLESPLAERMAQAQRQGNLHREQPFVMGIPASQVYADAGEELVLIQGIVDVYWQEEDGIVILDYKTDSVDHAGQLVNRYAAQLNLYGEALEKAAGVRVKEKVMYSFHLREAVEL